jgi:hypothetical protein
MFHMWTRETTFWRQVFGKTIWTKRGKQFLDQKSLGQIREGRKMYYGVLAAGEEALAMGSERII